MAFLLKSVFLIISDAIKVNGNGKKFVMGIYYMYRNVAR